MKKLTSMHATCVSTALFKKNPTNQHKSIAFSKHTAAGHINETQGLGGAKARRFL